MRRHLIAFYKVPKERDNAPLNFDHSSSNALSQNFNFHWLAVMKRFLNVSLHSTNCSPPLCTRDPYGELSIQWWRGVLVSTVCSVGKLHTWFEVEGPYTTVSCGSKSPWCRRRKECIVAIVPVSVPLSTLSHGIADITFVSSRCSRYHLPINCRSEFVIQTLNQSSFLQVSHKNLILLPKRCQMESAVR